MNNRKLSRMWNSRSGIFSSKRFLIISSILIILSSEAVMAPQRMREVRDVEPYVRTMEVSAKEQIDSDDGEIWYPTIDFTGADDVDNANFDIRNNEKPLSADIPMNHSASGDKITFQHEALSKTKGNVNTNTKSKDYLDFDSAEERTPQQDQYIEAVDGAYENNEVETPIVADDEPNREKWVHAIKALFNKYGYEDSEIPKPFGTKKSQSIDQPSPEFSVILKGLIDPIPLDLEAQLIDILRANGIKSLEENSQDKRTMLKKIDDTIKSVQRISKEHHLKESADAKSNHIKNSNNKGHLPGENIMNSNDKLIELNNVIETMIAEHQKSNDGIKNTEAVDLSNLNNMVESMISVQSALNKGKIPEVTVEDDLLELDRTIENMISERTESNKYENVNDAADNDLVKLSNTINGMLSHPTNYKSDETHVDLEDDLTNLDEIIDTMISEYQKSDDRTKNSQANDLYKLDEMLDNMISVQEESEQTGTPEVSIEEDLVQLDHMIEKMRSEHTESNADETIHHVTDDLEKLDNMIDGMLSHDYDDKPDENMKDSEDPLTQLNQMIDTMISEHQKSDGGRKDPDLFKLNEMLDSMIITQEESDKGETPEVTVEDDLKQLDYMIANMLSEHADLNGGETEKYDIDDLAKLDTMIKEMMSHTDDLSDKNSMEDLNRLNKAEDINSEIPESTNSNHQNVYHFCDDHGGGPCEGGELFHKESIKSSPVANANKISFEKVNAPLKSNINPKEKQNDFIYDEETLKKDKELIDATIEEMKTILEKSNEITEDDADKAKDDLLKLSTLIHKVESIAEDDIKLLEKLPCAHEHGKDLISESHSSGHPSLSHLDLKGAPAVSKVVSHKLQSLKDTNNAQRKHSQVDADFKDAQSKLTEIAKFQNKQYQSQTGVRPIDHQNKIDELLKDVDKIGESEKMKDEHHDKLTDEVNKLQGLVAENRKMFKEAHEIHSSSFDKFQDEDESSFPSQNNDLIAEKRKQEGAFEEARKVADKEIEEVGKINEEFEKHKKEMLHIINNMKLGETSEEDEYRVKKIEEIMEEIEKQHWNELELEKELDEAANGQNNEYGVWDEEVHKPAGWHQANIKPYAEIDSENGDTSQKVNEEGKQTKTIHKTSHAQAKLQESNHDNDVERTDEKVRHMKKFRKGSKHYQDLLKSSHHESQNPDLAALDKEIENIKLLHTASSNHQPPRQTHEVISEHLDSLKKISDTDDSSNMSDLDDMISSMSRNDFKANSEGDESSHHAKKLSKIDKLMDSINTHEKTGDWNSNLEQMDNMIDSIHEIKHSSKQTGHHNIKSMNHNKESRNTMSDSNLEKLLKGIEDTNKVDRVMNTLDDQSVSATFEKFPESMHGIGHRPGENMNDFNPQYLENIINEERQLKNKMDKTRVVRHHHVQEHEALHKVHNLRSKKNKPTKQRSQNRRHNKVKKFHRG